MNTAIIIALIAAAAVEVFFAFRLIKYNETVQERIRYIDSRERNLRDAMHKNGVASADLEARRRKLEASYQAVHVEYAITDKDRESYAESKLPAVAKSRIANKLGHEILKVLPDACAQTSLPGMDTYGVDVLVAKPE